ncbi:aminodeoxychorismate synthase [Exophiala viscosa]|uniref:aminodeoxychorismate synthase n=1 Tax=Exophiala viscosa TaxID=2486360 RepID=A0AAN6ICF2_9EURO|nr:aminodeoxychorismate synthase [Exophiala viscosa]
MATASILFIDAYDSFAENITALLRLQLSVSVTLIRIDCDIPSQYNRSYRDFFSTFDAIVLGPGPGNPHNESDVGLFRQVWECAAELDLPVLGICLGFQSLCVQYGTPIVRMGLPCHGHAKDIQHADKDIFAGCGAIVATNYNSLGVRLKDFKQDDSTNTSRRSSTGSVDSISSYQSLQSGASVFSKPSNVRARHHFNDSLEVLAWDKDDWVMAVKHKTLPFHGFQFHPESCKSNPACHDLVKRWWGASQAHIPLPKFLSRTIESNATPPSLPRHTTSGCDSDEPTVVEVNGATGDNIVFRTSIPMPNGAEKLASLCHKLSPSNSVLMLESTKRGRYSIYAFTDDSNLRIEYTDGKIAHFQGQEPKGEHQIGRDELIDTIENFMRPKNVIDDKPHLPFRGGFMGFVSYEFGTDSLNLHVHPRGRPSSCIPDVSLLWVDRSIVFDHETKTAHVQTIRNGDKDWVEGMSGRLRLRNETTMRSRDPLEQIELQRILASTTYTFPSHDQYLSKIRACQSELVAGNSYELCLTTEATVTTPTTSNPTTNSWLLYKNIQRHNPVPFAAYICLNQTTILSSSPEHFLSWSSDGTIDMVPMKGTVKKTPDMSLEKATAILSNAKETAENLMIADLIRHDLYSTVGHDALVEVIKLCDVIETETVFSLVSHIRAHIPTPADTARQSNEFKHGMTKYGIKALFNTLPPGSMTGAPKKRSCEILCRLEQRHRGVYSGAIGYMDITGNGAWSVCIRTAFSHADENVPETAESPAMQKWHIGAGGAITVLSDEEQEWEEMVTKLDSVMRGFRL